MLSLCAYLFVSVPESIVRTLFVDIKLNWSNPPKSVICFLPITSKYLHEWIEMNIFFCHGILPPKVSMEVNRILLIPWDLLICFGSSGSSSLFIIKTLIRRRSSRMIKMAYQGWRCSPGWFMSILVASEIQGHIAYSDHTHNQLVLVQSTSNCFLPILLPQPYNMSKLGNARI